MNQFIRLSLFCLSVLCSCTAPISQEAGSSEAGNVIAELYGGEVSLAEGIKASTSAGKQKYYKVSIANDPFIMSGWLPPDAMATNCAILLLKSTPQEPKALIEVEIQQGEALQFQFNRAILLSQEPDYDSTVVLVDAFIRNAKEQQIERCFNQFDSANKTSKESFSSFLLTFRGIIPNPLVANKVIGYKVNQNAGNPPIYSVNAVMIAEDGTNRMINLKLTKIDRELKITDIII